MKKMKIPDAHSSHPNVTPLIDIVMCMIVFYMMAAKIGVKSGAEGSIEIPESFIGAKINDMGNTVTLNVSADGSQPRVTTLNPNTNNVEPVALSNADGTKHPLTALLKQYKGQNVDFKVIIRADQNLNFQHIEPVLMVCAEAVVKNVNFATRQPGYTKKAE